MKFVDKLKNIGDAAAEAAKNAGGVAQDFAKAAQDKASYLKELNELKAAIRNQKTAIAEDRSRIADAVLAQLDEGKSEMPECVGMLAANIKASKAQIELLENQIEDLRATASVKNPDIEREINKAIAEIDKAEAIDIEAPQADSDSSDTSAEKSAE